MIPYGDAPTDLGHIPLNPEQMLVYLYLPVKMAGSPDIKVPERLGFTSDVLMTAMFDAGKKIALDEHYVYMTAKTLFVSGEYSGNRPGWHADGYGSNGDLNYIWYDMNPTEFAVQPFHDIPDDDFASMAAMEEQIDQSKIMTYPYQHLLRLDESVVHRVNPQIETGMRTFIKISVSKHRFNLKGNSKNYLFDYDWKMFDRDEIRNLDSNKDYVA